MGAASWHVFQVLTKRPERMRDYLAGPNFALEVAGAADELGVALSWGRMSDGDLPAFSNVWLGVSIENRRFVHRAELLRQTPAAVRFISAEPLLGPLVHDAGWFDESNVEHRRWSDSYIGPELDLRRIDWLIVGGESGARHRPMHPDGARRGTPADQERRPVARAARAGRHAHDRLAARTRARRPRAERGMRSACRRRQNRSHLSRGRSMSRFADDYYEENFRNEGLLWQANLTRALNGKRGKRALAELRDALRALPEKRLIAGALCTVGGVELRAKTHDPDGWYREDLRDKIADDGEGVCAIGAFLWFKKVRAGADPAVAFAELPTLLDVDGGDVDTAQAGEQAGLTFTLAWALAYRNDQTFEGMTPEQRYDAFMTWLDDHLSEAVAAA
jgi:hypothetical protein